MDIKNLDIENTTLFIEDILEKVSTYSSLKGISQAECDLWSQKLICILGPSGVGKSVLCHALTNNYPDRFYLLGSTVTHSRSSREIEINNCRKIARKKFQKMISKEEFIHWYATREGFYGIEKERIRTAIKTQKKVLIIFRSLSGGILKSILPEMTVIELRASIEVLKTRITYRKRKASKTISAQIESAMKDLAMNEVLSIYWKKQGKGNWYQVNNEINDPPIATEIVMETMYFLMK